MSDLTRYTWTSDIFSDYEIIVESVDDSDWTGMKHYVVIRETGEREPLQSGYLLTNKHTGLRYGKSGIAAFMMNLMLNKEDK